MFNNWDSAFAYKINTSPVTGDFVAFENKIYQSKTDNTGNQPDLNPADWDFIKDITFIFNFSDQFPFDYRVDIPTKIAANIVLDDNLSFDRIKSQINLLNAAGKTFEGVEKDAIPINQLFSFRP